MKIPSYIFNIKIYIFLFFVFLFLFIARKLDFYHNTDNGFILGDWLVNYHDGGFKRRGASGSFFFLIQDVTGFSLQRIIYFTQLISHIIFFIFFIKILFKKSITLLYLTLILSPLTFIFYLNDPGIAGRKELLLFNIFIYFIYLLYNNKLTKIKEHVIYLLIFIATFFHEIMIFYVPYFCVALYLYTEKLEIKRYVLFILSSLIPTTLLFLFGAKTNEGKSLQILEARGILLKGKGSIFDFSNDVFAHLNVYRDNPINYSLYIVTLILGIIHFGYYLKRYSKENYKVILTCFIIAIIYSFPLFVFVHDWGRWLHIHFILMLIILTIKLPKIGHLKNQVILSIKERIVVIIFFIPLLLTWAVYNAGLGMNYNGVFYFFIRRIAVLFNLI